MNIIPIIIGIVSSLLGAVAQILFKKSTKKLKFDLSIIENYYLICGLTLYGFSTILFVFALKMGDLSVLYPLIALSYVWVNLLSAKYLKEKMNKYKWTGVILILIGIIFTTLL